MELTTFNSLDQDNAFTHLATCCASDSWAHAMVDERPFTTLEAMLSQASAIWRRLTKDDYLQAFDGHPRIGDINSLREKFASTADSAEQEQSGMNTASDSLLQEMTKLNDEYFKKFGYIFIVCATGKSAENMLSLLTGRLPNKEYIELGIAAREQEKITQLRIIQLMAN